MKIPSHTLIRAVLPHPVDTAIKYLAVDLGVPVTQLMAEAALLLLGYHQRADGLPAPSLSSASTMISALLLSKAALIIFSRRNVRSGTWTVTVLVVLCLSDMMLTSV